MATITKKQRDEIEELVIKFFDTLDKSGTNSNYYKQLFNDMDDRQFANFIAKDFPFKFQHRTSVTEPSMKDIENSLDVLGVPLLEKISLPYLYENKDGKAVKTQKCFVGYTHHKKVQQIITKKNKWAVEIENRDMRTGRLIGGDKGSAMSEREFESLATLGLENTMKEFYGPKADAMDSKNAMYATISSLGMVRQSDIPKEYNDSLSKNMVNAYLIGAHISTNLINTDEYTPYTLEGRKKNVQRM